MNEPDHQLRHRVARRSFAAEDDRPRHNRLVAVSDAMRQRDRVHRVQQLPFVLVNAFDLNVEQEFRIDIDGVGAPEPLRDFRLARVFDRVPTLAKGRVAGVIFELAKMIDIALPVFVQHLGDQLRKLRIRLQQPSPGRDAVRLVVELSGKDFLEVGEDA